MNANHSLSDSESVLLVHFSFVVLWATVVAHRVLWKTVRENLTHNIPEWERILQIVHMGIFVVGV